MWIYFHKSSARLIFLWVYFWTFRLSLEKYIHLFIFFTMKQSILIKNNQNNRILFFINHGLINPWCSIRTLHLHHLHLIWFESELRLKKTFVRWHYACFIMKEGRFVEKENLKKVFDAILKIKKRKVNMNKKPYRYLWKSLIWTKKKYWPV